MYSRLCLTLSLRNPLNVGVTFFYKPLPVLAISGSLCIRALPTYLPHEQASKNIRVGYYLFSIIEQMTSAGDADMAEFKQLFLIKWS